MHAAGQYAILLSMQLSDAKDYLSRAADSGRLAHAYTFVGSPRGAAADLAVFMMQKLSCSAPGGPCGVCDTCRQIAARTWCDSLWVYPMKKSRVISVQQMRRGGGDNKMPPPYLLSWLDETSFSGGWKTGVISGADRMNEAAANAFLKMLEEPPARTLILLLTDAPHQLLPTIRSRCQSITVDEPAAVLPEPYRSQILAALAATTVSGPLAATALSAKLLAVMNAVKDSVESGVKDEIRGDESGVEYSDEEIDALVSSRYREYRALFMQTLQGWFRDLLVLRAGGDENALCYPEYATNLRARAARISLAQAIANIECVDAILRQTDRTIPENLVLSYWLDRMALGIGNP